MLNIKILQANLFTEKVGEVLGILEMKGTPTLPDQLVEEILSLALPVGDFVVEHWLPIVPSNVIQHIMTTHSSLGGKFIIELIGLVEKKLEKFLVETDLYNVWHDMRSNLVLLPSREAVRHLLQASQQLKGAINFFHQASTESAVLFQFLGILRRFFEALQDDYSHELVQGIWDVVNKALDAIDCRKKYHLISCFGKFEDVLFGYFMRLKGRKINFIEQMAKEFFDGNNGRRLVLLETLENLPSFTGEIDMICEKLGREDFQFQNSSLGISHPIRFVHVNLYPKNRKRRRCGSLKKTSKLIDIPDIVAFSHLKSSPETRGSCSLQLHCRRTSAYLVMI